MRWSASRRSGRLLYGSDMEGGGPYAYLDARSPSQVTGFEVELMTLLARDLGAEPVFSQGQWDKLLQILDSGRIDLVINGYESTPQRDRDYLATRPYYVYQLQLMVPRGSSVRSWADLKKPRPGGGRWTVGVLVGSAAETYASEQGGSNVKVVPIRRFHGRHDGRAERSVRHDPPGSPRGAVLRRAIHGPRIRRATGVARVLRDLCEQSGRTAARCPRPKSGPADRLGRTATAL